jgi:serine/threonine-protein kinase
MARDPELGRRLALKLLHPGPDTGSAGGGRGRLLREAQAMAQLSHPNVIAVYDVGTVGDDVFVAMELVEGGTLTGWLRAASRSWRDVVGVLCRAGEGLAAAHAAGLVHRDFKPDNVLVGDDGRVRVTDFGLARPSSEPAGAAESPTLPQGTQLAASATQTGTPVGTPAYMAPEQMARGAADARSDLFSFCVAFYEALYGFRPFDGTTLSELSDNIARGPVRAPPPRSPAPGWLRRAILSGLRADPQSRPRSMRALLDAIDAGLSRRRKRAVAAAFAALLGCAGVTAATLAATRGWRRDPPRAASLSDRVTPLTEWPPPASTSAEAVRAYTRGLQRLRDGEWIGFAAREFARAAELDPSMSAAHLRFALTAFYEYPFEAREHLTRAVAGRDALTDRDRLLLAAAQGWIQSQPADIAAFLRSMNDAQKKYPLDAEVAYYTAMARALAGDRAGAMELAARSLELDPHFGAAYFFKGEELAYAGDFEGALATVRDCASQAQNPALCLLLGNNIDAEQGDCGRVEQTTQQLLARDSSEPLLYYWLANAAWALGRPPQTVQELLRERAAHVPEAQRRPFELGDAWAADVLAGDFDAAIGRARELRGAVGALPEQRLHARAALWEASALVEAGRSREAVVVAQDFLQRKGAWIAEPRADDLALSRDPTPRLLGMLRAVGAVSPEEFERRRQEWVDGWMARTPSKWQPFVWLHGYAAVAETTEDAARALQLRVKFGEEPRFTPWTLGDAYVGKTYLLAGRVSEALPLLRRAARSCEVLQTPFEATEAHFALGQALASTGMTTEACAACRVVLSRWGHARPRSVTAEGARSLARALSCPDIP